MIREKNKKTDELVFRQTPWVIRNFLRGWQMDVPESQPSRADPRAFLEGVRPCIHLNEEELEDLKEVNFQLAL